MKSVAFVVNCFNEFDFAPLLEKYLNTVRISVLDYFPDMPEQYDLIVLWSYRRIVRHSEELDNVIIFHSSNLPAGRGWAPIYNTLARRETKFTICAIKLADPVDSGDIVVKAKFPILPNYTAQNLRQIDRELSIMLMSQILHRFDGQKITGIPQTGESSYFTRRSPEDNEIDISVTFAELIPHLRACEIQHPAFFFFEQEKFYINIQPAKESGFPTNIEIIFCTDSN